MSGPSTYIPKNALVRWFESRLPVIGLVRSSFIVYPVPRNLNYLWTFGGILAFMLVVQIVTGVVLAMHYVANSTLAFASIDHIMRDVNYGWLIRYLHTNGASMFFLAVYIHMFRGIYYGSYKAPREVLWILGVIIYVLMMATAFMGYVLPWGMMSFAGATVITNLFTAIPVVGTGVAHWLWGGYAVGNATLNRFFALHYLLPFIIVGVVVLHVWALHISGQNNPDGVEVKNVERDTMHFTPYATIKDLFALSVFMILYAWFVFFIPNYLLDADNSTIANPLVTPAHIVPEWYLLPFYAILRAIPNKLMGVVALFARDRAARLPALARHLQGALRQISAGLQGAVLDLCDLLRRSRLPRLAGSLRLGDVCRRAFWRLATSASSSSRCRCSASSRRPRRFPTRSRTPCSPGRLLPRSPTPRSPRTLRSERPGPRENDHDPFQDLPPRPRRAGVDARGRHRGARAERRRTAQPASGRAGASPARSACSIRPSSSAASRSTRKCAATATGSPSPSARSPIPTGPATATSR